MVLDPNRQGEPRFLSFTATLADCEAVFGVVTSEPPAALTIKGLYGKERTLLRSSIKSLTGTDRSLMPDGLEAALSKQDMADVIRPRLESFEFPEARQQGVSMSRIDALRD